MRITEFKSAPLCEFRFLNAGRGPGSFYEDCLPIHHARVDRLPPGVAAIVVTADLQGRERFEEASSGTLRLLGEVVPYRLLTEVLPKLSLPTARNVGAFLAGDFYTVPALDERGGTGDVTAVWRAFADCFVWVAGVAGNHDTFGEVSNRRPRFSAPIYYLDGDITEAVGIKVAGLGGIIGKVGRPNRRSEQDYLATLERLLERHPDVLLMHDGPDGSSPGQRGMTIVRQRMIDAGMGLVIRGHAHWNQPFAEFPNGLQVLNVDARVVILTA